MILRNERGSALLLLILATSALIAFSGLWWLRSAQDAATDPRLPLVGLQASSQLVRGNIVTQFRNEDSFGHIKARPGNGFDCLHSGPPCVGGDVPVLFDAAGTVYYDTGNAKEGFDLSGEVCDRFKATMGAPCPLRPLVSYANVSGGPALKLLLRLRYEIDPRGLGAVSANADHLDTQVVVE